MRIYIPGPEIKELVTRIFLAVGCIIVGITGLGSYRFRLAGIIIAWVMGVLIVFLPWPYDKD